MSELTRYVLLLHEDERVWAEAHEDDQRAYVAAHEAFEAYLREHGTIDSGEALTGVGTATTLRHDGDRHVLHDGPYAESAEQLGGFYVVEAPDLDVVVAAARLLPRSYHVEIRPVADVSGPR